MAVCTAGDLSKDISFDVYNKQISEALLNCMELLRTDASFAPLRSYTRQNTGYSYSVPLDRMIFLMCTMRAAKNPVYNQNASLEDPLRGAYYNGQKSIYNFSEVSRDFEIGSIDFIVMLLVAFKLIWDLAVIIFDCVARIFNMIFLYLAAPPFIGVMPLDDGGKFKQWTTAFTVQCFGVFGTLIAMRVLLLFIPIIAGSDLVLFDNSVLNQLGKIVILLGAMSTAKRASGVITGILADSAGFQAINATGMGDKIRSTMDHLRNRVTGYGEVGNLRKNDLGLRSMVGGKDKDKNKGSAVGGSSLGSKGQGGGKDSGPRAGTSRKAKEPKPPKPPPVPPMPRYDTRKKPPKEPTVPPMPHWNAEQGRQMPDENEQPPAHNDH